MHVLRISVVLEVVRLDLACSRATSVCAQKMWVLKLHSFGAGDRQLSHETGQYSYSAQLSHTSSRATMPS